MWLVDEVERIALWLGLLVGAVGISLSVVAIWFAAKVEKRSATSDQTLGQAVVKIEGAVDRISEDVRGMVREGFLRLLPAPDEGHESSERALAEGLAAEREQASETVEGGEPSDRGEQAEEGLEEFIDQLERVVRTPRQALRALDESSFEAQELARRLAAGPHLTLQQYQALDGTARLALRELEEKGLIVPLRGKAQDGRTIPVYWWPPSVGRRMRGLVRLLPQAPEMTQKLVLAGLRGVNYHPREAAELESDLEGAFDSEDEGAT